MNCSEYRELLDEALDVSLDGALEHRVRLHLEHCAACQSYYAQCRQEHVALFNAMNAAYAGVRLPAGFADRVKGEVALAVAARRRPFFARLPRWALVAASLALLAGFVFAAAAIGAGGTEATEGTDAPEGTEATDATEATEGVPVEVESPLAVPAANPVSFVPLVPSASSSTQQGPQEMNKKQEATAALAATLSAAPLAAARGDGYQFIISGDPVAAASAGSSSASSATSSLVGGPLAAGRVVAAALEGRFRTADDSATGALRSDKAVGTIISIR